MGLNECRSRVNNAETWRKKQTNTVWRDVSLAFYYFDIRVGEVLYCLCETVFFLSTAPATPTLQALVNELASVENWHKLGVNLGLQGHQLRKLEQDYPRDSDRQKSEMIDLWLISAVDITWEAVAHALCLMQEHAVAERIRRKHCCPSTTASKYPPRKAGAHK